VLLLLSIPMLLVARVLTYCRSSHIQLKLHHTSGELACGHLRCYLFSSQHFSTNMSTWVLLRQSTSKPGDWLNDSLSALKMQVGSFTYTMISGSRSRLSSSTFSFLKQAAGHSRRLQSSLMVKQLQLQPLLTRRRFIRRLKIWRSLMIRYEFDA
jgi:hypothetical protein